MTDQYEVQPVLSESASGTANERARIKSIYLHPIKSCGPVEVEYALLTKSGFQYDRCFAFASTDNQSGNATEWRFLSQRTKPTMSLIGTELWLPKVASSTEDPLVAAGGCLVFTFPDADPTLSGRNAQIRASLNLSSKPSKPTVRCVVPLDPAKVYGDEVRTATKKFIIHRRTAAGLDLSSIPAVAAVLPKLKRFLKLPKKDDLTLLMCTPNTLVRTDRNLAPLAHIGTPALHGYTDQQPVHINSLASVHAVSKLLPLENQPLNALRFRANLWITGAPAFDEETWKRCRILPKGPASVLRAAVAPQLSVVCRTSRCTMPNVIPDQGVFDAADPLQGRKKGKPQPSATLVEHRTVESGNPAALGYLGMHCVPEDQTLLAAEQQGLGMYVAVGDEIEVLERGEHLYGSTGDDY